MKTYIAAFLSAAILCTLAGCASQSPSSSPGPSLSPQGAASNTGSAATPTETDWPQKPVNFVIGFAAGGGADITARAVFQPFVEEILGQKFVISYQPGSNGEISYTEIAKNTAADGYTICWGAHPGFLTIPLTKDSCKFTLEDFSPIANISTDPNVFIVNATSELSTLDDLVSYAKENPGMLSIAIGALNADDDLACEQFTRSAGIEVNKIVYADGTTDRVTAVMGDHVQVGVINASEVTPYLGQVKILGVMAREPLGFLGGVETFEQQGYPVYNSSDRGVLMPAGVPEEIVAKLSSAIGEALKNPNCIEALENLNLIPKYMDYQEYKQNLQEMSVIYAEIIANNAA